MRRRCLRLSLRLHSTSLERRVVPSSSLATSLASSSSSSSSSSSVAELQDHDFLYDHGPRNDASASSGALSRQLTSALAPADAPAVMQLPLAYRRDLDGLYESLMRPLPTQPTQRSRLDKLLATEALDADVFFAERDRRDVDQHAHRIRCLGAQGHLAAAHEVLDAMLGSGGRDGAAGRRAGTAAHADDGDDGALSSTAAAVLPRPDAACYAALADACSRAGDVRATEGVLTAVRRAGLQPTAPLYSALIGAHRRANRHLRGKEAAEVIPEIAARVMGRVRREGVVEDAPLHTSVISWFVAAGLPEEAWEAFDDSRRHGVHADAVTYTNMLVACAQADRLEQARTLQMEMRLHEVAPTLATHNAFLGVCAARAASLTELPRRRHEELRRLGVDLDVQSAVRLASRTVQTLQGEGHAPDGQTYLGLLRVAAGAADVPRAQLYLTRMLDTGVAPSAAHFHTLLRACVRGQRYAPPRLAESHLQVALAAPPSMQQLGVPVTARTIDLVLKAHVAARRIYRAVAVLDGLYDEHDLEPSAAAFGQLLAMATRLRRPQLAADVLERMGARGLEPTAEQRRLPAELSVPREVLAHPRLPEKAWSARRGFYTPTLPAATRERWTVMRQPRLGGATPPARDEKAAAAVEHGERHAGALAASAVAAKARSLEAGQPAVRSSQRGRLTLQSQRQRALEPIPIRRQRRPNKGGK